MRKGRSATLLILSVLIVGFLAYTGLYGLQIGGYEFLPLSKTINRGLDLQGGISVVEEIQDEKVDSETIEKAIELISMRVNRLGVAETEVKQEGQRRIRIEIPGKFDSKEVIDMIGKTGELKFVGPDDKVILTGKDVKNANAYLNQENQPTVGLKLNDEGTKKFADATKAFLGQPITIYMDEDVLTAPTVQAIITNGEAVITGSKSIEDAKRTADIIKSGALPVTVRPVSFKTVGSTLGANALPLSKKAAAIGVGAVLLFMLLYYRIPGLLADIALILFIVLDLGVFSAIDATLTLAGIAGLLLTIGMAVDANVLIFARIREELKTGKSIKASVNSGFDRALSSILDSNITTIIAGIVLYSLGTGSVKGFALTLMIGIVISIFTALTITKTLLKLAINSGILNKAAYFGVKRG